jgi:hypothetical protein
MYEQHSTQLFQYSHSIRFADEHDRYSPIDTPNRLQVSIFRQQNTVVFDWWNRQWDLIYTAKKWQIYINLGKRSVFILTWIVRERSVVPSIRIRLRRIVDRKSFVSLVVPPIRPYTAHRLSIDKHFKCRLLYVSPMQSSTALTPLPEKLDICLQILFIFLCSTNHL